MKHIASRDNPYFKQLKKLCQSGRERRKTGRTLLDGMHLIESYSVMFGPPDEVIVSESGALTPEIARYIERVDCAKTVRVLGDQLFVELATVEAPTGIMAVISQPRGDLPLDHAADTVVLDGIQDPGNVGSLLRSAAGAGFRQILLSADCAHAWSPKTLRAAMGAHFALDIHESCDLPVFLAAYSGQAVTTALDASASLYALALHGSVAWVFGNEGQGVRPEVARLTRHRVRIPMPGTIESLNVAAAAAVCLFETVRQRQESTMP